MAEVQRAQFALVFSGLEQRIAYRVDEGLERCGGTKMGNFPETVSSAARIRPAPRVPVTVVDLETTGVYWSTDRVVEVAALRFGSDGVLEDTYETLINPERDVGPTPMHGITANDVVDAPTFGAIVGDLVPLLRGAVLAAHNVHFDRNWLRIEFERAGWQFPEVASVCTMRLPADIGLRLPAINLRSCCDAFGVPYDEGWGHSARHDAQVCAMLLSHLLGIAEAWDPPSVARGRWPEIEPSGVFHTRVVAEAHRARDFGYLGRLAHRVGARRGVDPDLAAYVDLLDRVLEDHLVTEREGSELLETARVLGLDSADVARAHMEYLDMLIDAAWQDGAVTDIEWAELEHVGHWLGIMDEELDRLVSAGRDREQTNRATPNPYEGMTVCFTGALNIARERAIALAEEAGCVTHPRVTKDVDVLVVADANTQSRKATRARSYGIRIVAAETFFRQVGVA